MKVGAPVERARAVAILAAGREQTVDDMRDLVERLDLPDVAYLLLEAAEGSWYPGRYWEPVERNEPWVTYSVEAFDRALEQALRAVPVGRVAIGGFSQGACIAAEYAARRPRPFGAVVVLTGALIGDDPESRPPVALDGVPVLLVTSEIDEWIDLPWVECAARFFERSGATPTLRVDHDPEHRINDDAVAEVRELLGRCCDETAP